MSWCVAIAKSYSQTYFQSCFLKPLFLIFFLPRCPPRGQKAPHRPPKGPKSMPQASKIQYFLTCEIVKKLWFLQWFCHIDTSSFVILAPQNCTRRVGRPMDTQKLRKCPPSDASGRQMVKNAFLGSGILSLEFSSFLLLLSKTSILP